MRKRITIFTILLTLLALLQGCKSSPLERMGGAIDSLVDSRPDSALAILDAMLPDTNTMNKRTLMRFHLLRTNAQNKCDTVLTARHAALMRRVCDYYDRRSSKREANNRMLAHYLLGRCYSDMGEAPAALQEFHNAADAADTASTDCNFHQLSLVHSQAGSVFNKLYMPTNELQELRHAARYALLGNDTLNHVIYEDLMAKSSPARFFHYDKREMLKNVLKDRL